MTKKINISIMVILILNILFICTSAFAAEDKTYISVSDTEIIVNGEEIATEETEGVYLTNSMDNGGTSKEAVEANLEIENVININKSGTYEFTGELSDGQISINSNAIDGEVVIILNNVDITCKEAPAIIVYNKQNYSDTCIVIIKTANESENTLTGGRVKQSILDWEDKEELSYFMDKGYDDDNTYYERYKYDGAISSDISLTFEGEGTLVVNTTKKEGIEVKRDITINSGNLVINSLDDGINACTDGESIVTINGGTLLINLTEEAEEGDGIDSNGTLNINGGKVFAFASRTGADSGLDADLGVYINGGYIVATGNMAGELSNQSKQKYMQLQFANPVSEGTLITITDKDENAIIGFESDRDYSILAISTPEIGDEEFYVYEGGKIEGASENGVYTEISSYELGTIKEYTNASNMGMGRFNQFERDIYNIPTNSSINIYYYTIIALAILLIVLVIIAIILKKKGKAKSTLLTLLIGIIIGALIATIVFCIYTKVNTKNINAEQVREMQIPNDGEEIKGQMMNNGQMSADGMPTMEKPTDPKL